MYGLSIGHADGMFSALGAGRFSWNLGGSLPSSKDEAAAGGVVEGIFAYNMGGMS